ncbi:unnamed protein product [Pleuronectes platessa]|uniref:Uncharacterized protein n=1 Tax=Pleuronectes platessa TaxID=8262 RepID=A0A9N7UC22_PLEPL|nr:unnamed protein product [Pleuronectes platessa]
MAAAGVATRPLSDPHMCTQENRKCNRDQSLQAANRSSRATGRAGYLSIGGGVQLDPDRARNSAGVLQTTPPELQEEDSGKHWNLPSDASEASGRDAIRSIRSTDKTN